MLNCGDGSAAVIVEGVRGTADTMRGPGALAEWLGRGLQSLVRRFESARRLWPLEVRLPLCVSHDDFERGPGLVSRARQVGRGGDGLAVRCPAVSPLSTCYAVVPCRRRYARVFVRLPHSCIEHQLAERFRE